MDIWLFQIIVARTLIEIIFFAMGTVCRITVYDDGGTDALHKARSRVTELHQRLNAYDKNSEISAINQNAGKSAIYNNLQRAMTLQTNTAKKTFSPQYINITIPIDKIIENLLIEFPAPPRGVFKVQYSLLTSEKYEISQSLMI